MTPTDIVLHHSATRDSETFSWAAIRRYHTQTLRWRDIGYHYGIEDVAGEPEIMVGRMMNESGAHCRGAGMNRRSLGVCFVGNFDATPPPRAIWNAGVRLVISLMDVFDIGPRRVHGHCDLSSKTCPGKLFDLKRFRAEIS